MGNPGPATDERPDISRELGKIVRVPVFWLVLALLVFLLVVPSYPCRTIEQSGGWGYITYRNYTTLQPPFVPLSNGFVWEEKGAPVTDPYVVWQNRCDPAFSILYVLIVLLSVAWMYYRNRGTFKKAYVSMYETTFKGLAIFISASFLILSIGMMAWLVTYILLGRPISPSQLLASILLIVLAVFTALRFSLLRRSLSR